MQAAEGKEIDSVSGPLCLVWRFRQQALYSGFSVLVVGAGIFVAMPPSGTGVGAHGAEIDHVVLGRGSQVRRSFGMGSTCYSSAGLAWLSP